jgi:hypothetical protein
MRKVAHLAPTVFSMFSGVIVTELLGSIAASQFTYASVSLTHHLIRPRKLMVEARSAIGRELRAELELPCSLPPELSLLITQMNLA